jgi:hypothetical protein
MNFKQLPLRKLKMLSFLLIIPLLNFNALALSPLTGGGEDFLAKPSEYELERMAPRTDIEMLSTNLAGENISLADGGLSFSAMDISIPLNMVVNASISRSYNRLSGQNDKQASEFGDWQLDLPRIESTYLRGDIRYTPNYYADSACSNAISPGPIRAALGQNINQHEYWNGATLTIPGQGGGKLLSGNVYGQYKTTDNMLIDCEKDGSGNEYFIVKTPNGLSYSLKQRRTIKGEPLVKGFKALQRTRLLYLVTAVEDRFGNTLNYQYQGNGLLRYITQTPKDGVQETLVTLTYTGDRVSSIVSLGKTWRYEYTGANLSKVIRPDNKFWRYEFPVFGNFAPDIVLNKHNDAAAYHCDYKLYQGDTGSMRVIHPYGAVAEFDYALQVHGRTEVPAKDMVPVSSSSNHPSYNINSCYATLSITDKRLTVKNGVTYNWQYQFANNRQHWNIANWNPARWGNNSTSYSGFNASDYYGSQKNSACSSSTECSQVPTNLGYDPFDLRVLTVTEPDNRVIKYYSSKRWDHTDGKVVATQWFDSLDGSAIKTERKTYTHTTYKGNSGITDPVTSTNLTPISSQVLLDLSITFENDNTYTQSYDSYNEYGALLQSSSFNSFNNNVRHVRQTYQHDTSNWLLNLPRQKSISSNGSSWTNYQENNYHSASGSYKSSPYETKVMGRVAARNSQYHSDGNLKKVDYVGTGRYEIFEDYKRGIAQKITLPCQKVNSCNTANGSTTNTVIAKIIVNNDGTVTKMTDFNGDATNYGYNSIGWVTKIDPVDNKWANTNITYGVVTTANDGLSGSGAQVGQMKQTISKGSSQKLTYFDGMLRPYLVRTRDTSNTATTVYQRNEYDYENRTTFSSFPSQSITIASGMTSTYDALGRKTRDTRTTDSAFTEYGYLSNNRVSVTDPEKNTTTTSYLAYGSPSQSKAIYISTPENTTTINYNLFGQVKDISQGGFTEYRYYDDYQQLCKTHRLDTGTTAFGYNSAGQMTWQAEGASGSTNTCDTGQVTPTQKTIISYNNWGNVSVENYPDGSPDKIYNYDEKGQLETLTAGGTVWNYLYNSLGMVEKQTLSIDSKNFVIDPTYNSLGHVQRLTYPSGRVVDFAPNALGQATKAGIYAKSAKYHANGSLDSFTYGNNLTYKRALNSEQQPYELSIKQGSSYKSRHRYLYDDNNNVDYIYDFTDRSYDIDLGYDGLDRLVSGSGKWGTGSFSYDDLGNILTKRLGSQALTYHYDTSKNRLSSVSGSAAYSFQYDARGNVANNGRYGLIFNRASQLINAKGNAYVYDGHNRLVKKVSNGKNVYSVYGMDGTLYYREDSQQKKIDYIRLGTELVAKDDRYVPPNTTPTSPPNAVSSISGYVSTCNIYSGCNFVSNWQHSLPNTVTYYELYQLGGGSSDTCPPKTICANAISKIIIPSPTPAWMKVYSGGSKTFTVTQNSTSLDFKVRACNALGCSAYSAVITVSNEY